MSLEWQLNLKACISLNLSNLLRTRGYLVQIDSAVVDLPEGVAFLDLLQHLATVGLVDDGVALGVDGAQIDLAGRAVGAASVVQHIAVADVRVPVQQLCSHRQSLHSMLCKCGTVCPQACSVTFCTHG